MTEKDNAVLEPKQETKPTFEQLLTAKSDGCSTLKHAKLIVNAIAAAPETEHRELLKKLLSSFDHGTGDCVVEMTDEEHTQFHTLLDNYDEATSEAIALVKKVANENPVLDELVPVVQEKMEECVNDDERFVFLASLLFLPETFVPYRDLKYQPPTPDEFKQLLEQLEPKIKLLLNFQGTLGRFISFVLELLESESDIKSKITLLAGVITGVEKKSRAKTDVAVVNVGSLKDLEKMLRELTGQPSR